MDGRDKREPAGEENQPETCQTGLAQPLDHASKNAGADNDTHAAEIHHEESDVGFGDRKSIGKNQWQRWSGAIESADTNGVDPDQSLRGFPRMCDDTPHCAGAGLRKDLVFAGGGAVARLAQIDRRENADQNAEYRRRNSGRVPAPVNQNGSDGRSNYRAETGCRRKPAEALRAIVRVTGVGDISLHDADGSTAETLHNP